MLFLAFLVWNWLFGLFAANWVILALSHSKQRFCCFVANFLFSAVFALKKKVLTLLQLITLFSLILHRIMYMKHFEWIEIWFTLVHLIQKIPTEVFPNCCIDIMNLTMFWFFFSFRGHGNESCNLQLVLYPASIFLSLPKGHGKAFVSRRVHLNFRCLFS